MARCPLCGAELYEVSRIDGLLGSKVWQRCVMCKLVRQAKLQAMNNRADQTQEKCGDKDKSLER